MEHFKLKLIEYLDYNNCRIKAKLGLAACTTDSKPFGCLNNSYFKILSNFLGSLHMPAEIFCYKTVK